MSTIAKQHSPLFTPAKDIRGAAAQTEIRFGTGKSSLGLVLVAQSDSGICAILLGDDADALERDLQDRFPQAELTDGGAGIRPVIAEIVDMIEAPERGLDLPLDLHGTDFQRRVWQVLRKIPVGETASYAEVARRIGSPDSIRSVASACAANALAVAIPCHRVVRSDGGLSGYRWGVERKRALLEREARA
jgi:AraC family transcriptional regulator of adaptative response/methylated-DNA-[protein]-cysteine methyltransferase